MGSILGGMAMIGTMLGISWGTLDVGGVVVTVACGKKEKNHEANLKNPKMQACASSVQCPKIFCPDSIFVLTCPKRYI